MQSADAGGASVMAMVGMRSGSLQRQALPAGPVGSLVPRRSGAHAEDEFAVAEAAHVEVERKQAAVVERGGGEKRPPEKLAHLVARAQQDNDISAVGRVVTGVGAFLDAEGPGQPADAGFQRNHHLRGRLHHQNLVAIEFVKRRRVGGDGLDRHDVEAAFLEDLGDDGRLLRAPGRGRRNGTKSGAAPAGVPSMRTPRQPAQQKLTRYV